MPGAESVLRRRHPVSSGWKEGHVADEGCAHDGGERGGPLRQGRGLGTWWAPSPMPWLGSAMTSRRAARYYGIEPGRLRKVGGARRAARGGEEWCACTRAARPGRRSGLPARHEGCTAATGSTARGASRLPDTCAASRCLPRRAPARQGARLGAAHCPRSRLAGALRPCTSTPSSASAPLPPLAACSASTISATRGLRQGALLGAACLAALSRAGFEFFDRVNLLQAGFAPLTS